MRSAVEAAAQGRTRGRDSDSLGEAASLELRDVVVSYGGVRAVNGVSLTVAPGNILGIVGPNGAGKSSLLAAITGDQRLAAGSVRLAGADVTRLPPYQRARRGLSWTFQQARTFDRLSVLDSVVVGRGQDGERLWTAVLGRRAWGDGERAAVERAWALLCAFGLQADARRPCGNLSGGQRAIVQYLRAIMSTPRVLLLDEPTAGLAPGPIDRMAEGLAELAAGSCSIILIEHEMAMIERVCDRVIGMVSGNVVVDGRLTDVVNNELIQTAFLGSL